MIEVKMKARIVRPESGMRHVPESCDCFDAQPTRREFIGRTSCALFAALAASGVALDAAHAHPVAIRPISGQGTDHSYPLPSEDGVNIDQDNEVILVRSANHIYAFALACPHENTALRWRQQDQRFQCPRHESKYQPDGTFLSGRATRNMDRFALRRDGQKVVVNLVKLYRSDQQKAEWESAVITL
jgi:nitrite reductase/ring-hydroxylating ferredoxin subunit